MFCAERFSLKEFLISGLNRHDSFFSMFQASILAMVEVASTFETEPTKENLQIEILNCCVDNYAVPSEYQHLSKFVDSLTNLLKQLDFSLWKVLSGPTWISKLSFDIEKKYALVINNELNIFFNDYYCNYLNQKYAYEPKEDDSAFVPLDNIDLSNILCKYQQVLFSSDAERYLSELRSLKKN